MKSDLLVVQARQHQMEAARSAVTASQHRAERDRIVCQLRAQDPDYWSYGRLSKAVGVSRELIALIIKGKPESRQK